MKCPYCNQTNTRKDSEGYCIKHGCNEKSKQEKIAIKEYTYNQIIKNNYANNSQR